MSSFGPSPAKERVDPAGSRERFGKERFVSQENHG